ncbi:MAG: universal stress protein [Acidobacteriota bacterium]|nr:universal stress protein [Acidobacteriota bacterium]
MQTFQNILFPVDLSEGCAAAAPFIETLARKFDAHVTLLHVLELPPAYFGEPFGFGTMIDLSAVRDGRQNELDGFLKYRFQGLSVRRVMLEGDPATEILQYAHEHGVDLIAMPTHGTGVFRALLLGSATSKVLHDAPCPVWTAEHIEESNAAAGPIRNIMCAVDTTEDSLPAMRRAAALAGELGAKLWLVHAIPSVALPERYFEQDFRAMIEIEARKTIAKMQAEAGLDLPLCVGVGDVAKVVREAALHHQCHLLVAGRGHLSAHLGRLRTHVYSLIRESPCPVISV